MMVVFIHCHPPVGWPYKLVAGLFWLSLLVTADGVFTAGQAASIRAPLSSLQSYTGLLNMPTARVLPHWSLRLHYGQADPYRYYGGALGIWDRLEIHGQFTQIETITAFPDYDYGDYKDRSAGAKLVLLPEDKWWPQLAVGFFDATGTALFGQRYAVASKTLGRFDLTLGLGQGVLAGEFVPEQVGGGDDQGLSFLTSSPFRKTRPFGGVAWQMTSNLRACVEYSPIDYDNMFGFRNSDGRQVRSTDAATPINLGLKFQPGRHFNATLGWLRGETVGFSASLGLPLDPHGLLGWKQEAAPQSWERRRWQAYQADNKQLANMVKEALHDDGFASIAVACSQHSIWLEARNSRYLSDARALSRMAAVAGTLLPARITSLYCNLVEDGQVITSLHTNRAHLQQFLQGRQSSQGFLKFADLDLYATDHWQNFQQDPGATVKVRDAKQSWNLELEPEIRTFLNNRSGFFKHKGVLRLEGEYQPWVHTTLFGSYEVSLFNQYDELIYEPLEEADSVRTDLVTYQKQTEPRLTELGVEQYWTAPGNVQTRLAAGIFETAYAGVGGEAFRYFHQGRWGLGAEAVAVRKRHPENDFALDEQADDWFAHAFVNIYSQILPDKGLEGGLKIGRFLAGDPGVRLDLRIAHDYFTIGGWITWTDTSVFDSSQNKDAVQKGVYVRVPFAIFTDHERKGHFRYGISSFTRDQGVIAAQPSRLYPMDPWSTPRHVRDNISDMRHHGAAP